ncbi:HAMP domain-containing sensor histidine kinase [uncultured Nitratireductor sp.]|uniref:sensor histidine kinase n=1 Tax=uncultured Nitratireductor sp. TaxID=520953 RepID=UPI00261B2198|nr:HAMP domain-containing sensor histidine kinase [uncultured Nitratireductor sp.]
MLDLKTLLLLEFCTTTLQAIAWVLVWMSWRHLYELKVIAAGFVAIALGLLLLLQRGQEASALRIVLDNMMIKIGLVLLADGMARFLGQPRCLRIGVFCLAVHLVFWVTAVALAPERLELRIHASTAFTVVMMGVMIKTLYMDRTQPPFLRWITIALLGEYIGASLLQSFLLYWYPDTFANGALLSDVNAWYFFQGHLFIVGFFICLLFMVGMRLSNDLRDRNSALAREVAERRRLEGELSASLDAEKAAREEQRQLIRMVSHEFRTPLAGIRYASEMLEMMLKRRSEAVTKRLRSIDDAVSRMTMLIDRFLSTERQVEGVLKVEQLDIGELTQDIQRHFDQVGLGDRLHFTTVEAVSDYWADVEMLRTVIVNLIDNALKYSADDKPVEIAISARNKLLIMEVSDRGIGIPEGALSHVGRRFFRAPNTGKTAGNGLGLHTCRQLLGYHRGAVNLKARSGGGTVATVMLPMPGLVPMNDTERWEEKTA